MQLPTLLLCAAGALLMQPRGLGQRGLDSTPSGSIEIRALIDATAEGAATQWFGVHDSVMGGVSRGAVREGERGVQFAGQMSLENNGGFASFRTRVDGAMTADADGLRLRVRGDGQNWKLSLRGGSELSWQAPFATAAGGWTTIDLPFSALVPSFRGRFIADAPTFDPATLGEVGLVIADGQAGEFMLELDSIEAWRAERNAPQPGSLAAQTAAMESLATRLESGLDAAGLLEALRWKQRLLVVCEPLARGSLDKRTSLQLGRFFANTPQLARRDLCVVQLLGERGARVAGRTLDAETTRALRREWSMPASSWGLALIGKDGGVKARWSDAVGPAEVYRRIDAMPMAREEQRDRADS
ncbi:MAG: CIA30 family protein [Planctomycetota bacterium]